MKKWVNPYTFAFVVGAAILTALPILQRRFLSAPPPIGAWGQWQLRSVDDGKAASEQTFAGKVVMVNFVPSECDSQCLERVVEIGKGLEHTDDLGDKVAIVTLAWPPASQTLLGRAQGRWQVLSGDGAQLKALFGRLRAAWEIFAHTDAGDSPEAFATLPAIMVVDQLGAIRGFWKGDEVGRGNAINAARLLAKEGPNP
jgi:cytochrome oxidase Cu insertion factor (SCO1/SenC/PrrC family)